MTLNDYTSKKYDNTNKGILWNIPTSADGKKEMALIKQGKINMDGEEHRIYGVSRKNRDGDMIMSVLAEIGTIKVNPDAQPELRGTDTPRRPDSRGIVQNVEIKGTYQLSGWMETSQGGNQQTSLKVQKLEDDGAPTNDYKVGDSFEDIPI